MRIRMTAPPEGGSKSIYRTTNASRAAVEDMNIHHRCHDVTVEPGRPSPMSLFRGTAEAALNCAHRTSTASTMLLPRSHRLSQEGGLFGLPLRASNEGLLRPRVARAKEANRLPSHSSLDRGT